MKNKSIIIFIIAIALLIIAIFSLGDNLLTSYVPFKDAIQSGKYVQIIGKLDKSIPVTQNDNAIYFSVIDKNNYKMKIFYKGIKPMNFEHSEQVVLLGQYDPKQGQFSADKMLVKCPSKYEREK